MYRTELLCAVVATVLLPRGAVADVPVPDAIVYGFVYLGEAQAMATDDLTVFARLDETDTTIALYRMGDIPTAGDRYVLRIPQAVSADGRTPSTRMAQAGQLAKVYVQEGSGPPQVAADLVIPPSGSVQQFDLRADLPPAQQLPSEQTGLCGAGAAGCGAMGMVPLWLTVLGLRLMRRSR